jgi:hypothetical protein
MKKAPKKPIIIDNTDKLQRLLEASGLNKSEQKAYIKTLKFKPNVYVVGIEYGKDQKRAVLWHKHRGGYNPAYGNDHDFSNYLEELSNWETKMVSDYFKSINKKKPNYITLFDFYVDKTGIPADWNFAEEKEIEKIRKAKRTPFVGDYQPQRSTVDVFKALKNSPIATEPLGLGAMPKEKVVKPTLTDNFKVSKLSKIKKGEFFRFVGRKKVYIFDGKPNRGFFSYHKPEDHNSDYSTKQDKDIEIGFTY